ncbi:MAG: hypothetical protein ACOX2K_04120 [Bacillota bacterium]|jgi:LPXTG-motif cell wall-anchored protein
MKNPLQVRTVSHFLHKRLKRRRQHNKTGFYVAGLGALVSGAGLFLRNRRVGNGVLGFGLAHVVLGGLDLMRPALRR